MWRRKSIHATSLEETEDSMNAYRDIVNAIKTAERQKYAEGHAEGLEGELTKGRSERRSEALVQVARDMQKMNIPINKIKKSYVASAGSQSWYWIAW